MLVIVALLVIVGGLYSMLRSTARSHSSNKTTLAQQQKQFVSYVDTLRLPDKTLVFESSTPLCDRSDCTLSKAFIYKLDGNYRDNGKEILAYLKSKGFDFQKDDPDKYKVPQKLNDAKLADNLSNADPIIVDLYNNQRSIRVRVSLGDLGRTLPYAKGPGLGQLPAGQLVAGLDFFNP